MAVNKGASATGAAEDSRGRKSKLKLIVILLLVLVVIGSGGAAAWFFLFRDKGEDAAVADAPVAEVAAPAVPVRQPAVYEPLEPAFVVNFSRQGRQRYMQVSVTLMGRDPAAMEALNVHAPLLRNQLVMLFSAQEFDRLLTPVGLEMLRTQATQTAQDLSRQEVGKSTVEQVLFTNFVLQ